MGRPRVKEPDWRAIERARIGRARAYYRETTPGERVEDALRPGRNTNRRTGPARAGK